MKHCRKGRNTEVAEWAEERREDRASGQKQDQRRPGATTAEAHQVYIGEMPGALELNPDSGSVRGGLCGRWGERATSQSDLVALQDDFVTLQDDFVTLQDDFVALQDDFVALQDDFVALQNDFVALQNDLVALQNDFAALQDHLAGHKNRL